MTTFESIAGTLAQDHRRLEKASAAFRLTAATPDPVAMVVSELAESDHPRHFFTFVGFLAQHAQYPDAALLLEAKLVPVAHAGRRLVKLILGRTVKGNTRVFRIAVDLKVIGPQGADTNQGRPAVCIADLIEAATAGGPKFKNAYVALAALGFVRSPRGIIPIEETSDDCPGQWPASPSERLALALSAIIRLALNGERFDSIRLVQSP